MSGADEILTLLEVWQDDLLEFACRLIAAPSPTPPGDERQVAQVLVDHLRELGLNDITIAARKPERPNVICRIGGQEKSSPTLILNGHIDTKPVGDAADQWDTDPLEPTIRDGRLYGLGATDMKGAVAAFVYAGAAIARAFPDLPGELLLVFSADEEGGSTYGGKYLAHDYGLRADAAIVCEPTGITRPWEFIAPVARGISCFKIKVKGTQMHSSLSDQLPSVNASVKLAGVLERMSRELEIQAPSHPLCPDGITVNLGVMLHGGVTYGVYPGYAEFAVDVRTIPGMTLAGVERDVEGFLEMLRREDPQLDVELAFEPLPVGWTPPCEVPAGAPVVRSAQAAAGQVLGTVPPLRALPAVTDGAHFAAVGIDTIPAFGPGLLPLAHCANEYIEIKTLGQAAQIYALTTLNFFKDPRWQKPKD
jgi:acetylornithine deacetylase/succinyl-diaminopimelate desuccinylase-like protein